MAGVVLVDVVTDEAGRVEIVVGIVVIAFDFSQSAPLH